MRTSAEQLALERLDAVIEDSMEAWRPPPLLHLSEWADQHFFLSAESAAAPGRWHTLPYQRGIMDAITDPTVERVSLIKSARVGYTKMIGAAIAYYMAQDPCPIMVVQPTVEDAEGYSKEELATMIRDCAVLTPLVTDEAKGSGNTILHKVFPGGSLSVIGANSPRGFRRVSRRILLFDEVDGYPASAGPEGDPIKLGIRRTEFYWNRKIIAGSTPLLAGYSRIAEMFEAGDQRRYYVPCPQCGHMDYLVFRQDGDRGHYMTWPKDDPEGAHFVCRLNGCVIEHKDKQEMVARGEWRAAAPFRGHASFHIWAAYSSSPNATWGQLAAEFLEANKGGPEKLKTFVNTVLGETWVDRGEAPEWERLFRRREHYAIATVPAGPLLLTAGVDVQKDRLVYEVVGWGEDRQSWSVDAGVLPGDTSAPAVWESLDELLGRTYLREDGVEQAIQLLAVDSGFNTQVVYNWARRYPMTRVIATKGVAAAHVLIGTPTTVDVTARGKRIARGYKVWPVGVNVAKSELYGWLGQEPPIEASTAAAFPPGYCHFPEYGDEYFRQLTAEHRVSVVKKAGYTDLVWQQIPGRENHFLDCRIMARAAASLAGLDRLAAKRGRQPRPRPGGGGGARPKTPGAAVVQTSATLPQAPPPGSPPSHREPAAASPDKKSWLRGGKLGGGGRRGGGDSWLKRRR